MRIGIQVKFLLSAAAAAAAVAAAAAAEPFGTLEEMRGGDGAPKFRGLPVEAALTNPWPADWEAEFQNRARQIIKAQAELKVAAGNTYFENEKRTYGYLMAQALGPRGMDAIRDLQVEDAQREEWHRETMGIDFYAAFTIKHQIRKYFYFGKLLEPEYRQRMFDGGKAWTAKDPLRRPHYAFRERGPGWGPEVMNSWVDVRSTDNLWLMRTTSVYLMAEETGNEDTRQLYAGHLRNYTRTLYRAGLGEWDSENYHGHSIPPWLNLYDFAKDPEIKALAKAALDWMFASGAVKYFRGGFNGPSKRDYNHVQPFGGSAPTMLWVMFGGHPAQPEHWESDEVHIITSSYRAPAAVVRLARKEFGKPLTLFASKPPYTTTTSFAGNATPEFLETQHFGHHYQIGSLASGTSAGKTDTNGFKILIHDETHGALALQAVPGPDPLFVGSPQYQEGKVSAENRVAQDGPLALWLVKDGTSPWVWVVPDSMKISHSDEVTFLKGDRAWVAVRPIQTTPLIENDELTHTIREGKRRFPGHKVLSAVGRGGAFCGLAVETGEAESHGTFANFREAVLEAEVDESRLTDGAVIYKSPSGRHLGIHWQDDPHNLGVWRNGARHDFKEHADYLYRPADSGYAPIYSRRGSATLYIEAGREAFACNVGDDGRVRFSEGKPAEVRAAQPLE